MTRPGRDALRLLADPLRARIVELLAVEQLCTCHLVELTGARQTNISNHLRLLREAGLVTSRAVRPLHLLPARAAGSPAGGRSQSSPHR